MVEYSGPIVVILNKYFKTSTSKEFEFLIFTLSQLSYFVYIGTSIYWSRVVLKYKDDLIKITKNNVMNNLLSGSGSEENYENRRSCLELKTNRHSDVIYESNSSDNEDIIDCKDVESVVFSSKLKCY